MRDESFHNRTTIGDNEGIPSQYIPPTPKFIGPYKIESLLEKGGMSFLYLGTHQDTGVPTTVKVLSPKFLTREDVIQRFLHEAEIIALADHPNIVKLSGFGQWEKGLYIAMEFIEGLSLRQHLLKHPISLKQAIDFIIDIAYALCHLHTHGVIHRDLKPENILVTENGSIKVIDFGIAQLIERPKNESENQPKVIGTPIYMSPEQKENPHQVTYSSDIYSLGIIAYELVLGKLSHGRIHLSLVPKGMQRIISKTLQPNPQDRYQDIVDLIGDLSIYAQSSSIQSESLPSDRLKDMADGMNLSFLTLCPSSPPLWHGIESAHGTYRGELINTLWYDYLVHKNQMRAFFTFSPEEPSVEGFVYMAVVRGLIKSLFPESLDVVEFLTSLNNKLLADQIPKGLKFNMLLFHPDNSISIFTSHGTFLWHFNERQGGLEEIQSDAQLLGKEDNPVFNIKKIEWESGDRLIHFQPSLYENTEMEESKIFIKEKILESINNPLPEMISICINKIKRSPGQDFKSKNCFFAGFKKV